MSPATSSITFCDGSLAEANRQLTERVAAIVVANPWLSATLDWDPDSGELALFYQPETSPHAPSLEIMQLGLRRTDSYEVMNKKLLPALCRTSNESVGCSEPLWKVTLVPVSADRPMFAVVVSANHSLLDGHGFYRLHNMLSTHTTIESLNPERNHSIPGRIRRAMSGERSAISSPMPGFVLRFMWHQLLNALFPRTKSMGFYLDVDWVKCQKKITAAAMEVDFVSTNDVYVSNYCRVNDCDYALMAMNFRGRVDECTDDLAGNYEDLMQYLRQDYESPALIRRSVSPSTVGVLKRCGKPMSEPLSNREHLFGRKTYAALTNWSTFSEPLEVAGGMEVLHLPLINFSTATPARIFSSTVIFRAKGGRVAVLIAGSAEFLNALRVSGMVGDSLGVEGL